MNKAVSFFLVLLLATAGACLAQGHPGGGGGHPAGGGGGRPAGGGGSPGGGAMRSMPAMPPQQQPVAPAAQGFNLNRDVPPEAPPQRVAAPRAPEAAQPAVRQQAPVVRQQAPAARVPVARAQTRTQQNGTQRTVSTYRRAPTTAAATGGQYRGRFHGEPIRNGRVGRGAYGWNHGVAWQPASIYWGGGFWGPFALADLAGIALYGNIDDGQDQRDYVSYEVEPDSPGYDLLADYGLTQTPCGNSNLVVIWGPNGSVICAYPDGSVGAGEYEVDPSSLTLVPAS